MAVLKRFGVMGLFLLFVSSGALFAQRWDMLGTSRVDGARDHDNIRVSRSRGMFRAIQFRVRNAAVEFDRVVVHYSGGASEPIRVRARVQAGGSSGVIDLPGQRRAIDSIEFWYSKGNWASNRRPEVQVYGLR
jgi:hypothetical protein